MAMGRMGAGHVPSSSPLHNGDMEDSFGCTAWIRTEQFQEAVLTAAALPRKDGQVVFDVEMHTSKAPGSPVQKRCRRREEVDALQKSIDWVSDWSVDLETFYPGVPLQAPKPSISFSSMWVKVEPWRGTFFTKSFLRCPFHLSSSPMFWLWG